MNTAELHWRVKSLEEALADVVSRFEDHPGISDLDDEQPITVRMSLGEYRRATRLYYELIKR